MGRCNFMCSMDVYSHFPYFSATHSSRTIHSLVFFSKRGEVGQGKHKKIVKYQSRQNTAKKNIPDYVEISGNNDYKKRLVWWIVKLHFLLAYTWKDGPGKKKPHIPKKISIYLGIHHLQYLETWEKCEKNMRAIITNLEWTEKKEGMLKVFAW